jgi:hypothetical protein
LVHFLFLTHRSDTPSTRYRVAPFVERLTRDGHHVRTREYSSSPLPLWAAMREARDADAVVLQKRLPPAWISRAIRKRAKRLIYDFDDAVYVSREDPESSTTRSSRFEAIMAAAHSVVAGNSHLAARARASGAGDVAVIPTVLEPAKYESATPPPHDDVVAGWIGAGGNLHYLEALLPKLKGLPVRIRVVCNRFPPGVEAVPWTEAGEAEAVAGMDIGLAPMPDDEWTRGKCGTRVLQYFAAGVPVVAEDVGAHRDLVGGGGFLVRTDEQWRTRIGELAADAETRRKMGAEGRARLKKFFTPDAVYPQWLDLLRG